MSGMRPDTRYLMTTPGDSGVHLLCAACGWRWHTEFPGAPWPDFQAHQCREGRDPRVEEALKGLLSNQRKLAFPETRDYRHGYVNALSDVAFALKLPDLARTLAKEFDPHD